MTTEGHKAALQRRHHELEIRIEKEMQHKSYNDLLISELKRRKLEVKDALAKIESTAAA